MWGILPGHLTVQIFQSFETNCNIVKSIDGGKLHCIVLCDLFYTDSMA